MPTCVLLPLDPWDLPGVKGTALRAISVCAGNKATRSKPRDPLVCKALPKKQTLRQNLHPIDLQGSLLRVKTRGRDKKGREGKEREEVW